MFDQIKKAFGFSSDEEITSLKDEGIIPSGLSTDEDYEAEETGTLESSLKELEDLVSTKIENGESGESIQIEADRQLNKNLDKVEELGSGETNDAQVESTCNAHDYTLSK